MDAAAQGEYLTPHLGSIAPPPQLGALVQRELGNGEALLWSGQPLRGVRLQASDLFLIPFSLMWGGFAIFWESMVLLHGAPWFFALWGVPFVVMGLYLMVGRFFADAWRRSRTVYALTNERVLILSGGLHGSVSSLQLRTLNGLSFREGRGGVGTIAFAAEPSFGLRLSGMEGWPGSERRLGPRFALLPSARSVYEAIRAAQQQAR